MQHLTAVLDFPGSTASSSAERAYNVQRVDPRGAAGELTVDAVIRTRLAATELAGERVVAFIRVVVAVVGCVTLAAVWYAQSPTSRWMFATLVGLYVAFSLPVARLLHAGRYHPRLKYVVTAVDLVWVFALTGASVFNYSGVYETYRAPVAWLLIALFNAMTALRLSTRLGLFAGVLTLTLGFAELALIGHFVDVPWSPISVYVGPGLHLGDVIQTVVFTALPAFAAAFVALHAHRLVHTSARTAAEHMRTEAECASAVSKLDQAREQASAKEQLLRIASHELRSPIQILQLATQLMDNTSLDNLEQVATLRGRINRQAERLGLLVNELLDVSRLSAEHIALARNRCDLSMLCREVATDLDPTGTRIQSSCGTEVTGMWDASRLQQVITNLLRNALRYSAPDTVIHIEVRTVRDRALLEVRDRGIGIAPEDIPHLFSPFFRGTAARKHETSGLGLGLYIAHEIVRLHDGTIDVTSELGLGTTFTVELPVAPLATHG